MDKQGLKLVFLYQKYLLLAEILFAEHTLSEEIILNEASLEGSPAISGTLIQSTLHGPGTRVKKKMFNGVAFV